MKINKTTYLTNDELDILKDELYDLNDLELENNKHEIIKINSIELYDIITDYLNSIEYNESGYKNSGIYLINLFSDIQLNHLILISKNYKLLDI